MSMSTESVCNVQEYRFQMVLALKEPACATVDTNGVHRLIHFNASAVILSQHTSKVIHV
jgi:hypothetical protein